MKADLDWLFGDVMGRSVSGGPVIGDEGEGDLEACDIAARVCPESDERVFEYYTRLGCVRRYVRDHLADPIPLCCAAALANLTPRYFAAYFRAKVGVTFREWLARERVRRAAEAGGPLSLIRAGVLLAVDAVSGAVWEVTQSGARRLYDTTLGSADVLKHIERERGGTWWMFPRAVMVARSVDNRCIVMWSQPEHDRVDFIEVSVVGVRHIAAWKVQVSAAALFRDSASIMLVGPEGAKGGYVGRASLPRSVISLIVGTSLDRAARNEAMGATRSGK